MKKSTTAKSDVSPSELISRYIADLTDWRGKMLAKIRKCFQDADPEMVEEWKWMGSPTWSRNGLIAVANAHKDKVKVTFGHGAQLPDRHKLFNNGFEGNKWRAIDIHQSDRVDAAALKDLIRDAIAYNLAARASKRAGSKRAEK
jgi:hypothetical protein